MTTTSSYFSHIEKTITSTPVNPFKDGGEGWNNQL
jgi:hypothetical protein